MNTSTLPDVIGRKFGQLTVTEELPRRYSQRRVRCVCECGTQKETRLVDLVRGQTVSCGCWKRKPRKVKA